MFAYLAPGFLVVVFMSPCSPSLPNSRLLVFLSLFASYHCLTDLPSSCFFFCWSTRFPFFPAHPLPHARPLLSFSSCLRLYFAENCLCSMASLKNPTSIPAITALREQLDYGNPRLARCQAFCDSVRVFRKEFVSSQGWHSSSIHDWKSGEHQTALSEMVRSYLELQGNGSLFWPEHNLQGRANKYKYSTDSARSGHPFTK